jgi:phenylacetic acid degradation operon negative regulatory protein
MKLYKKGRRRLGRIERDILEGLSAGDLLYAALFSGRSTKQMFKLARQRALERYRRKKAVERLLEEKFIRRSAERLTITDMGRGALGEVIASTAKLLQTKWDGKWRIVIFDIPEQYAVLRNKIRTILKRAGFRQLQLSVWIFPYECEELARLIKEESRLSKHILYGTLEHVENNDTLKKSFNL